MQPGTVTFLIDEGTLTGRGGKLAASAICRLDEYGVGIGIDGVGTGRVALGNLLDLPIDKVKLSRELVAGLLDEPHRQALAIGIVDMAQRLGIGVGAVGAANQFQVDFLTGIGLDELQGSCIGRCQRSADVPAYLSKHLTTAFWRPEVFEV